MKRNKLWKQFLSVVLSVAMVTGLITVSEPREVEAAEQLVWEESFEDSSILEKHDGTITSQTIVSEASNKYLDVNYGGWGIVKTLTAGISVDSDYSYQLKFRINIPSTTSCTRFYVWCQDWTSAGTNYVTNYNIMPNDDHLVATTDGWQEITVDYTPTAGNAKAQFFLECSGTGDVYLDDLQLYKVVPDKEPVDTLLALDEVEKNKYLKAESMTTGYLRTGELNISAGETYELTYRLKISNTSGSIYYRAWYQEYSTDWAFHYENYNWSTATTADTDGWTTVTLTYTANSSSQRVMFFFEQPWAGTADVYLDDISFTKKSDSTQVYHETFDSSTGFETCTATCTQTVVSEENWMFDATNLESVLGEYYTATVNIDGKDVKIPLKKSGSQLVVPAEWFAMFDTTASVPTESLKIPEGTILTQADPDHSWAEVAGGDRLNVTEIFLLENTDSGWIQVEQAYDIAILFDMVNVDNSWIFKADTTNATESFYKANVVIDGTAQDIVLEKTGTGFTVWPNFFTILGGSAVTTSFKLEAGTILTPVTSVGWTEMEDKDTLKATKTVEVLKNGDTWEVYVAPEAVFETNLNLNMVQEDGTWKFNSAETLPSTSTAQFFETTIKIDGADAKVAVENSGTQLTIWKNFFTQYGYNVPTGSLVIPAGTVFYEIDTTGSWPDVLGGTQIVVTEELKVLKSEETWVQYAEPKQSVSTTLSLSQVNSDNAWVFDSANTLPVDGQYFAGIIKINDVYTKVAIQNTGTQLIIHKDFFGVYGGSIPSSSLVIPVGTIFYEMDTAQTGWPDVSGGTQIVVTKELKVTKDGSSWVAYIPPEAEVHTELDYSKIQDKAWYFNSTAKLPTSGQYFIAELRIDGDTYTVPIENNGSQLIIWSDFFTAKGGRVPTELFTIPAGTVLYEANSSGWTKISGGTQIVVDSSLSVITINATWTSYYEEQISSEKAVPLDTYAENQDVSLGSIENCVITDANGNIFTGDITEAGTYNIQKVDAIQNTTVGDATAIAIDGYKNISLDMYQVDLSAGYFRFVFAEDTATTLDTNAYYSMTVVVDGTTYDNVLIEYTASASGFEHGYWTTDTNFLVYGGAHLPSRNLIIPAGTILTQVDPNQGWAQVEGSTPVQIQNEICWTQNRVLKTEKLLVYSTGDVSGDDAFDTADLVAIKKIEEKTDQSSVRDDILYCANMDGVTNEKGLAVDAEDVSLLRQKLMLGVMDKVGNDLVNFQTSDKAMNDFLNNYFVRHIGYVDEYNTDYAVTTVKPGETAVDTFYQEWMAKSLFWFNSETALDTDRYNGQKEILADRIVDEYGYVWCNDDSVRQNNAQEYDGKHSMGWPFPSSREGNSFGYSTSWIFNEKNENSYNWSSDFDASVDTEQGMMIGNFANKSSVSFNVNITKTADAIVPYFAPWLEIDLRMDLDKPENVEDVYIWFTNSSSENFSAAKCVKASEWAAMHYEFTEDYEHLLYFPMYAHKSWGESDSIANGANKIHKIKVEIRAKEGATISGTCGLNSVRSNFDTRHPDNQATYITALYEDISMTGDTAYLAANLNNARKAMNLYMQMYDTNRSLIKSSYMVGHDGDKSGDNDGSFSWIDQIRNYDDLTAWAMQRAHAIGNGYWDATFYAEYDFETNLYFYKALQSLIALEKYAAAKGIHVDVDEATIKTAERNSNTIIGIAEYNYSVADLEGISQAVLAALRADCNTTEKTGFWNPTTGRFAKGYDSQGQLYDFGYTQFNTEAITLGIATEAQSESIMKWLSGETTVSGDKYTGDDIYTFAFAPRSTTVANTDALNTYSGTRDADFMQSGLGIETEEVQSGGAMLWTSYYDIMARLQTNGAEDAYSRLRSIADWYNIILSYDDTASTYFYYNYYADKTDLLLQGGRYGENSTTGGNASGMLGIESEFAESVLLVSTMPYGFFGISGTADTLCIAPSLPSNIATTAMDAKQMRAENLMFQKVQYDLTVREDEIRLDEVRGNDKGLMVQVTMDISDGESVYVNGQLFDADISAGKAQVTVELRDAVIEVR